MKAAEESIKLSFIVFDVPNHEGMAELATSLNNRTSKTFFEKEIAPFIFREL